MGKYFGPYGGQYVGEVLKPALAELEGAMKDILGTRQFQNEYASLLKHYAGRPTPLYRADNLTEMFQAAAIYIKLEGMAQTGAHKINNALGQVLLAKHMGKKQVIAETGAGQHGVATAAAAAKLGLGCTVFMGELDVQRQQPNVYLMRQFGAEVHTVRDGTRTLKDAVNAALKRWVEDSSSTSYVLGSALGPYPYPDLVRTFQEVIGRETRMQILEAEGSLPDKVVACCGGGSNAVGIFSAFLDDPTHLIAVEAGGRGTGLGEHAQRMSGLGEVGIIEGYKSFFLQDEDGQVQHTHSISAGLDYPGIGPQLAYLGETGRVEFTKADDQQALEAYQLLARKEGLLCALESAHAAAVTFPLASRMSKDEIIIMNMSGRGEKDLFITARALYHDQWLEFLEEEVRR